MSVSSRTYRTVFPIPNSLSSLPNPCRIRYLPYRIRRVHHPPPTLVLGRYPIHAQVLPRSVPSTSHLPYSHMDHITLFLTLIRSCSYLLLFLSSSAFFWSFSFGRLRCPAWSFFVLLDHLGLISSCCSILLILIILNGHRVRLSTWPARQAV